jgi:hypothetical protein
VRGTERKLKKLGYDVGAVDGRFTEKTERAVKRFQRKHDIDDSGFVGGRTMGAIDRAVDKRQGGDFAERVLAEARKHLGFREGSGNANPFSRYFGRPGEAWCADFVSYCYTKAGRKLNDPWTVSLLAKLRANGTFHRNQPKPGEIVIFDWSRGRGPPAEHTGLVERTYQRNGVWYVQTIEGNSGDMCRRRTYPVSSSSIVGFGTVR